MPLIQLLFTFFTYELISKMCSLDYFQSWFSACVIVKKGKIKVCIVSNLWLLIIIDINSHEMQWLNENSIWFVSKVKWTLKCLIHGYQMENIQSFANFIENLNSMNNLLKLYCVAMSMD